jgi:hypothetical protein
MEEMGWALSAVKLRKKNCNYQNLTQRVYIQSGNLLEEQVEDEFKDLVADNLD